MSALDIAVTMTMTVLMPPLHFIIYPLPVNCHFLATVTLKLLLWIYITVLRWIISLLKTLKNLMLFPWNPLWTFTECLITCYTGEFFFFHLGARFCSEEMLHSAFVSSFSFSALAIAVLKKCVKAGMHTVAGSSFRWIMLFGLWGKPHALSHAKARERFSTRLSGHSRVCGVCWLHTWRQGVSKRRLKICCGISSRETKLWEIKYVPWCAKQVEYLWSGTFVHTGESD